MQWSKRSVFLLVLACVLELGGPGLPALAEPSTAWVARYNGLGNGRDDVRRLVVDSDGNVYVTGASPGYGASEDYATIKYDAQGNQLWVARYDGPVGGSDAATALVVDNAGNVYVTGRSSGGASPSGTGSDYATIKYDAYGNELWVARYNGPSNGADGATALALDESGNVYVTGQSLGSGRIYDYATVKYDADGNEMWAARFAGQGSSSTSDSATAIAVDGAGNVYVTGYAFGRQLSHFVAHDYATVKYDALGNELWARRYGGTLDGNDEARALTLDGAGNVYVTGRSSVTPGGPGLYDYVTIKYDALGNQLWIRRYNGPAGGSDSATALALDADGNAYVTGSSDASRTSPSNPDYATVKYDAEGNELWVARYNGPGDGGDSATALALDGTGGVYVTGTSAGPGAGLDYATVKYDAEGNELWVARYDGPNNREDRARALAVDAAGNVYVAGWSGSSYTSLGSGDYTTIKYVAVPDPPAEEGADLPQGLPDIPANGLAAPRGDARR